MWHDPRQRRDPAYNDATRYLEQAMRSVRSQTFRDLKVILVDDASTDDTGRLVLRIQQARYIRRAENGGQAAARNDGARLANGEFLAFLDQDDVWEPTFLEESVAAATSQPDTALVHAVRKPAVQLGEQQDPMLQRDSLDSCTTFPDRSVNPSSITMTS